MPSAAFALPDRTLVLDRYRPLRPLGRGGSGSVWLARDEQTGLDVALKIVPREGKRAARAAREMEAASRLRHERCVRAYDFGADDGHVYIAYEYVRGRTLRELIRTGELDDAAAVELSAQILEGLAHAHRHGIVHRDVKPSNVLVEDGEGLSARVLDFGLAQFDEADTLTAVGDVPGTLAYIAPERLDGSEASERSDVWAVGVILWEALAGSHPFWGVPLPEVASTIVSGAPPLSARRGDLSRRLLAAVDAALSVDPAKRPPAARLATELREALSGAPARPRPAGRRAATASPREAHPPGVAARPAASPGSIPAAAAVFATLLGGSLLPFWPTPLLVLLAVAAGLASLRAPRAGLAIALAAPVFPLGNVSQAAAVVYGALALAWLAVELARCARRARVPRRPGARGVRADRAPAPRSPARARNLAARAPGSGGRLRGGCRSRAFPAAICRSGPGPFTTSASPRARTPPPSSRRSGPSSATTRRSRPPRSRSRSPRHCYRELVREGTAGIAALGVLQLVLVMLWGPSIPWPPMVLGTLLLCLLLVAAPVLREFVRGRGREWTRS